MTNLQKNFQLTKSEREALLAMLKDIKAECQLRELYSLQYEHLDLLRRKSPSGFSKGQERFISNKTVLFFKSLDEDIRQLSAL